jgi:hypothetical protein
VDSSISQEDSDSATKANSSVAHASPVVDSEQREAMIRKAAYFRAESRGLCPGKEVEDWLAAETEIDRLLTNGETPTFCGE